MFDFVDEFLEFENLNVVVGYLFIIFKFFISFNFYEVEVNYEILLLINVIVEVVKFLILL